MYEQLHIRGYGPGTLWVSSVLEVVIVWLTSLSRDSNPATDSLTPYLLHESADDRGICADFLAEAVSRFEEDETVKPILTKAVAGMSLQLSAMTMNDNYKPHINVCSLSRSFGCS